MRTLLSCAVAVVTAGLTVPVPASCSPHCTASINAAIQSCSGQTSCTVVLDAGTYVLDGPLHGTRIQINGLSNFALVGAGPASTHFVLDTISAAFAISGGSNVTLSGFSVDQQRVPFTYGQVTGLNSSSFTVTFDASADGLYPINTTAFPWLLQIQGILSYDPSTGRIPQHNFTDDYFLPPNQVAISYPVSNGPNAQIVVPKSISANQLGTYVVLRHQTYGYNAITASNTAGVTVSDVALWATGGMGFLCNGCSDITADNFRIEKLSGRPMSICADGIHFSNPSGFISIRNSLFEGQGDDGINMPTIFYQIVNVSADGTSIQVEGRGNNAPIVPSAQGTPLNVFNRSTMELLGQVTITSIGPNATLHVSSPLPAGAGMWSLVNAADSYASTVEVVNNVFRNNRARGALLKQSNVFASNNTFEGVSGPSIKTETDGCYWFEGHPVSNWTITGNVFNQTNFAVAQMMGTVIVDSSVPASIGPSGPSTQCVQPTQAQPAVQHGLTISDNVFYEISGLPSVAVYTTQGLTVQGNQVTRVDGSAVPQIDLLGDGVTQDVVSGNVCDGRACVCQGL